MATNQQKINAWFERFDHTMNERVPRIIAEAALTHYRESFSKKSWDNKPWPQTKKPVKNGSLMIRSGALLSSVRESVVSPNLVRLSAGNKVVKYARIHNEGGTIFKAARSEMFVRNRYTKGKKSKYFGGMGAYKRGTTFISNSAEAAGRLSFKAHIITIPKRQYMGHSAMLNKTIITLLKKAFNTR